jgi:serine/threonine protein phosphatase PrpC
MGTTATLAAILGRTLTLCQVGDSRAYIIRDRQALQVTKDQSLMQKLIDAGEITPEAAEVSARRNIILQALGPEPSVSVDVSVQQLEPGDVVLLCSDGLTGQLRNQEIADIVTAEREVSRICSRLIERANETGGPDNITVVVARVEGDARTGGALPARGGHIAPMLSALLGGIAGLAALVALVLWWRV